MTDFLNITLTETITLLDGKLHDLFVCNDILDQYVYDLQDNPENPTLLANRTSAAILSKNLLEGIDNFNITPINLIQKYK